MLHARRTNNPCLLCCVQASLGKYAVDDYIYELHVVGTTALVITNTNHLYTVDVINNEFKYKTRFAGKIVVAGYRLLNS